MCVHLDFWNATKEEYPWQALAEHLGLSSFLTMETIKNVAAGEKKSPSTIVLDHFFNDHSKCNVSETLAKLSNALGGIDNKGARDLVEKEITQRECEEVEEESAASASSNVSV